MLNPEEEESTKVDQIDWKKCLTSLEISRGDSEKDERLLSQFVMSLRDKYPETKWEFVIYKAQRINRQLLQSLDTWLNQQIAKSDWPFPKKVILSINFSKDSKILLLFTTKDTLPQLIPFETLNFLAIKDNERQGWKISHENIKPKNIENLQHEENE